MISDDFVFNLGALSAPRLRPKNARRSVSTRTNEATRKADRRDRESVSSSLYGNGNRDLIAQRPVL
jgi:hypothetical protein